MSEQVSEQATAQAQRARPETIRAVPVRHPGRWVAAAIIAVLLAMLVHNLATNTRWQGWIINQYLFTSQVLHGLLATLWLTLIAMVIGIVGGVILAVMRLSDNPVVSSSAWVYIWFFRGTPVLVQLIFWYNIAALFPTISIGIPFGPSFHTWSTTTLITTFAASILGLGLNEAAYMAEIVRAGILSVDEGQNEAACALGMRRLLIMRRIVLPQAMRVIIPPTGNETIGMLKTTSLVSVIASFDLLVSVQRIYNANYKVVPLLVVASIWYLVATSILTAGQYYVERHYARGSVRGLPPTPPQKFREFFVRNIGVTHRLPAIPNRDARGGGA
ncbi:amino acid ABC transporter permease [Actinocrinis sp.]|uniref:amino acid ABC transporter permease n=1 Tax=Actinocrinis sp. TaxID=1920516 RepID=UPI002B632A70|nr:amino acid ABC transporter permease [Actinocrinis sp.]HXR73812.1 amino acid ABC transporter permease [Actinocrinis sp.]